MADVVADLTTCQFYLKKFGDTTDFVKKREKFSSAIAVLLYAK